MEQIWEELAWITTAAIVGGAPGLGVIWLLFHYWPKSVGGEVSGVHKFDGPYLIHITRFILVLILFWIPSRLILDTSTPVPITWSLIDETRLYLEAEESESDSLESVPVSVQRLIALQVLLGIPLVDEPIFDEMSHFHHQCVIPAREELFRRTPSGNNVSTTYAQPSVDALQLPGIFRPCVGNSDGEAYCDDYRIVLKSLPIQRAAEFAGDSSCSKWWQLMQADILNQVLAHARYLVGDIDVLQTEAFLAEIETGLSTLLVNRFDSQSVLIPQWSCHGTENCRRILPLISVLVNPSQLRHFADSLRKFIWQFLPLVSAVLGLLAALWKPYLLTLLGWGLLGYGFTYYVEIITEVWEYLLVYELSQFASFLEALQSDRFWPSLYTFGVGSCLLVLLPIIMLLFRFYRGSQ